MANVPAKLKTADIFRFAQRAAQLEKIKPPVAYWCYYWIVNQILAKSLHTTDEECMTYTTNLVDKLEEFKVQYASDDAIINDAAGQAYVEQFGLETFQRADNAIRANRASKQTAETFQAAGTFLDLLQIWNSPSPDIASKIKYAKYHALRIVRAIKAGEDPNLSNPDPEPRIEDIQLDPNDPEVQKITGAAQRQPSVEEVPDEQDRVQRSLAVQSIMDQSLHPSRASSLPRPAGESPPLLSPPLPSTATDALPQSHNDAQPFQPPANPRHNSVGGGYFPEIQDEPMPDESTEPSGHDFPDFSASDPSAPPTAPPADPQDFYTLPSPGPAAPFSPPLPRPQAQPPPAAAIVPPPRFPQQNAPPPASQSYATDDEAVMDAQKHAKWAISALNFEDVNTAVKELRLALRALGAQ